MNLNPLTLLEKAINEHGSAVILNERLILVKEMLAKVEKEKLDLEEKLSNAQQEIFELRKQIPGVDFVEYMGVKFKRKPSGGYEKSVYCLDCEVGMGSTDSGRMPFICGKCQALTTFHACDLEKILYEVSNEYP